MLRSRQWATFHQMRTVAQPFKVQQHAARGAILALRFGSSRTWVTVRNCFQHLLGLHQRSRALQHSFARVRFLTPSPLPWIDMGVDLPRKCCFAMVWMTEGTSTSIVVDFKERIVLLVANWSILLWDRSWT